MKAAFGVWWLCAVAAVWPLRPHGESRADEHRAAQEAAVFPGWPETFEGRPWIRVPLDERVATFAAKLGGETGVFVQEERVVVLRWIAVPSRTVHPISDCFRARGYRVTPGGLVKDPDGRVWSEFIAERHDERWRVRERIIDERAGAWTDMSAWYWAAQRAGATGPWWAVTIAVRES